VPWHAAAQVRVLASQPTGLAVTTFFTPFWCVAEFTVVGL
jgi:hypothetical protein